MGGSGDVPKSMMNRAVASRLPVERSERVQSERLIRTATGEQMTELAFARLHPKTAEAMGISRETVERANDRYSLY